MQIIKNIKTDKAYTFMYVIAFFFSIKPDYFLGLGLFTTVYNNSAIIVFFVLFFNLILIKKINKYSLIVIFLALFPLFVSLFYGNNVGFGYYIPVIQTCSLALLIEKSYKKNFNEILTGLVFVLELYVYINFITIILFPEGIIDVEFYSGNYWFLGYKNVMIRFILPTVGLRAILCVYRSGKYTFSFYCLLIISILTNIIVDCKTGAIGIIIVAVMALIFSKKTLPKWINLKTGIIVFVIITLIVTTTQFLENFNQFMFLIGEEVSLMSRTLVWENSLYLFFESPIWGYGLMDNDGYRELLNTYTGWGYFSHPHNFILYTLIQGGLIQFGMACYLFFKIGKLSYENKSNFAIKMLIFVYLAFFVMGLTESLIGATLIYPLAVFAESFVKYDIQYKK